jgi:hypothetical protein
MELPQTQTAATGSKTAKVSIYIGGKGVVRIFANMGGGVADRRS